MSKIPCGYGGEATTELFDMAVMVVATTLFVAGETRKLVDRDKRRLPESARFSGVLVYRSAILDTKTRSITNRFLRRFNSAKRVDST